MLFRSVDVEGIDIVMALDISGSMMAMDFRPNRLEACKSVIKEFIENRSTDRIGLVVYSYALRNTYYMWSYVRCFGYGLFTTPFYDRANFIRCDLLVSRQKGKQEKSNGIQ